MVSLTGSLDPSFNPDPACHTPLTVIYNEVRYLVDMLLTDHPGSGSISAYFAARAQHEGAVQQDLLPMMVFLALSDQPYDMALPLAATWSLHLAAAHFADEAQDQGALAKVHDSLLALAVANKALAQLTTDGDTLRDVLEAVGQVAALGVAAQGDEQRNGRDWSRNDYFRSITGKAAAIIATGIWLGGRVVTTDATTLTALKEFGLALGMVIQLSDDCLDLAEDLAQGTFTLPVLEGLALTEHPHHKTLARLIGQPVITPAEANQISHILNDMGAVTACQRLIRAYQLQAGAVFALFPGLERYFSNYVAART